MIGGIPAFVIAQLGGAELAVIAVQNNRFDYFFVATPEIRGPEDLRGKTVAGTRRGALADTALDFLLRYWGLEPLRDVYIAEANGGESVRAAALVNGAAIGTVMVAPLAAEFQPPNYNVLANMSELDIAFASNGLAAPRDRLARDPSFYDRLMRAYIEGNQFFRTHPEEGARGVMACSSAMIWSTAWPPGTTTRSRSPMSLPPRQRRCKRSSTRSTRIPRRAPLAPRTCSTCDRGADRGQRLRRAGRAPVAPATPTIGPRRRSFR